MPLWAPPSTIDDPRSHAAATPEQLAAAQARADDEGTSLLDELERLHPSKVRDSLAGPLATSPVRGCCRMNLRKVGLTVQRCKCSGMAPPLQPALMEMRAGCTHACE